MKVGHFLVFNHSQKVFIYCFRMHFMQLANIYLLNYRTLISIEMIDAVTVNRSWICTDHTMVESTRKLQIAFAIHTRAY